MQASKSPPNVLGMEILARRIAFMLDGLVELAKDPGRQEATRALRNSLMGASSDGFAPVLDAPAVQSHPGSLDPRVRTSIAPIASFDFAKKRLVMLSSPLQPELIYVADYADAASARPSRVSVIAMCSAG